MAAVDDSDGAIISPEVAFAILGNDIRISILHVLGQADEPLAFSELRKQVGVRDSGQFNYHLDKLVGHFIRETDSGYELRRAGERIIEAVLSGAVTEAPVTEPTEIGQHCPFCRNPIQVHFGDDWVRFHCTECDGYFGRVTSGPESSEANRGNLGSLALPPAGLRNRTPDGVVRAAWVWGALEQFSVSCGVCPRCSAEVSYEVSVCETHEADDEVCDACGRHYASLLSYRCSNCIFAGKGLTGIRFVADTSLLEFLTSHDLNPFTTYEWVSSTYEEEIRSVDPFEARFTYTIDQDSLSLLVDDELNVISTTTETTGGPA